MKNYKIILALGISALALASCADKAFINGTLDGAAGKDVVITKLNGNIHSVIDTVRTKADGTFSYALEVEKGKPEFIYVYFGSKPVAQLLLESGEKVSVKADTLGNFETSGSEGSAKLAEAIASQAAFAARIDAAKTDQEISKAFVDHYREAVRFIMTNQKSLSVIPVLYENIVEGLPLFNKTTDAIMFRSTVDSLKTVYPESQYVKALEKETVRREMTLDVNSKIGSAEELGYPNLTLPDMSGKKVSLTDLKDNKVVLLHFWSSQAPAQSIFNNETLLPIYNEFHDRGFEIYSVCLDADKAQWGGVVKAQNLPWINVNDGLGAYSPAVTLYNVTTVPSSFLIANGELSNVSDIKGASGLRTELGKLLRQ